MISTTTVRLNNKVKEAAKAKAKKDNIRGGFSAYVEILIKADLKKNGIDYEN